MGLRSYVGSSWSYAPRMTASEAFWALEHAMKRSGRGSPPSLLKIEVAPTAPQSPPWIATRRERQRSQYSDRCLWGAKTFMLDAGRTPAAPRPAGVLLSTVVARIQEALPGVPSLSDEVVGSHLSGEVHAGLYPLLRGDACRLLVCDFDGAGWLLDALRTWTVLGRWASRSLLSARDRGTVPASGPSSPVPSLLRWRAKSVHIFYARR